MSNSSSQGTVSQSQNHDQVRLDSIVCVYVLLYAFWNRRIIHPDVFLTGSRQHKSGFYPLSAKHGNRHNQHRRRARFDSKKSYLFINPLPQRGSHRSLSAWRCVYPDSNSRPASLCVWRTKASVSTFPYVYCICIRIWLIVYCKQNSVYFSPSNSSNVLCYQVPPTKRLSPSSSAIKIAFSNESHRSGSYPLYMHMVTDIPNTQTESQIRFEHLRITKWWMHMLLMHSLTAYAKELWYDWWPRAQPDNVWYLIAARHSARLSIKAQLLTSTSLHFNLPSRSNLFISIWDVPQIHLRCSCYCVRWHCKRWDSHHHFHQQVRLILTISLRLTLNSCGFGTPILIQGPNVLSTGGPYTYNGPIRSAIAYVSTTMPFIRHWYGYRYSYLQTGSISFLSARYLYWQLNIRFLWL